MQPATAAHGVYQVGCLKGNDAMAGLMSRRGYRAADCPQDATMLIYSLELGQNR